MRIVLSLLGNFRLLSDPRILILIFFTGWLIFSQPEFAIRKHKEINRQDQNSLELILVCSQLSVILTLIDWSYFHFFPVNFKNLIIGLCLLFSGIVFRIWAIKTLGHFFTTRVVCRPDQVLIITGPYKYFRHPSYTGALMVFLGVPVLFSSVVGFTFTFVFMGLAYYRRIKAEEEALIKIFGDEYSNYMKATFGLVPGI